MGAPRNLLLVFLAGVLPAAGANPSSRAPVLVELFTSEGCSSCPPADRLLEQLDPRAIVLSEHVDYWNHQGWKDPFSSRIFTGRQEVYGRQFRLESVYTPEMLIDGEVEFSGSDGRRALQEISKAAGREKAALRLMLTNAQLHVESGPSPKSGDVFLALAEDSGTSEVSAGENKGRRLRHVAILRSLRKIGTVKRGESFTGEAELGQDAGPRRVIVFVQEPRQGRIFGAALLETTKN